MTTYLKLAILLICSTLAGGCDRSSAAAPPEGWGNAYQRAAVEYWGVAMPPDCGSLEVEWDSPVPETLAVYGRGATTIPTRVGEACVVWMAPAQGRGVFSRCVTYAHEYGHLLGEGHSADRQAVMAPEVGAWTIDPYCAGLVGS